MRFEFSHSTGCQRSFVESKSQLETIVILFGGDVKDRLLKANHNDYHKGSPHHTDVKDRLLKANHNLKVTPIETLSDVKDRLLKANHNSLKCLCSSTDDVKDRLLKANHNTDAAG